MCPANLVEPYSIQKFRDLQCSKEVPHEPVAGRSLFRRSLYRCAVLVFWLKFVFRCRRGTFGTFWGLKRCFAWQAQSDTFSSASQAWRFLDVAKTLGGWVQMRGGFGGLPTLGLSDRSRSGANFEIARATLFALWAYKIALFVLRWSFWEAEILWRDFAKRALVESLCRDLFNRSLPRDLC